MPASYTVMTMFLSRRRSRNSPLPRSIPGSTLAIFSCCNERWTLATFLTIATINGIHSQFNLPPHPLWRKRYINPPSRLHGIPAINQETRQNLVLCATGSLASTLTPNLPTSTLRKHLGVGYSCHTELPPLRMIKAQDRQHAVRHTHSRPLATFSFTITTTPLHSVSLTRVHVPASPKILDLLPQ